jgi:hypothetical protein
MATIEPRLMHLLNDSQSDLPPIQDTLSRSVSQSLSLPPLVPDGSIRTDFATGKLHQPVPQPHAFYGASDELPVSIPIRQSSRRHGSYSSQHATSQRSSKNAHSLQLLLDNPEDNVSSLSLRMILDDPLDAVEDSANKKRQRAMTVKEDYVQLPQPLKKQKSTQQVVPPIINGLHEPPPEAAMFPPISSERAFGDGDTSHMGLLKEPSSTQEDPVAAGGASEAERAKAKRKATKPRRKWSEKETNHLLLGVSRHGVGKWTTILEDRDFNFDDRTAGDLKDRFRTCCPDELRGRGTNKLRKDPPSKKTSSGSKSSEKKAIELEDLLIATERQRAEVKVSHKASHKASQDDADSSSSKPKKSRAHRKKLEDLAELGIQGPFKKSHRRERRPFTDQDDREILLGLEQYGPAWTKIQRDPRYDLSRRQPTDLRDRVRNKYPDVYARIEKGHYSQADLGPGNSLLEPSVNMTIQNSLTLGSSSTHDSHLPRTSSKDDLLRWSSSSNLLEMGDISASGSSAFDLNDQPSSSILTGNVNEMDISRLLLDDAQLLHEHARFEGH